MQMRRRKKVRCLDEISFKKVKSGTLIALKISNEKICEMLYESIIDSVGTMATIDTRNTCITTILTDDMSNKFEALVFISKRDDIFIDRYTDILNSLPIDKICENNDITEQPSVITLDEIMKYE